MNTTRDWIALSLAPGLGPSGFWNLLNSAGSPSSVLDLPYNDVKQIAGLRKGQLDGLRMRDKLRDAASREMDNLVRVGALPVILDDPAYPELLKKCVNPPPVLYLKGRKASLSTTAVAIVGSRAATGYGRRTAFNLGRDLARNRVTVVSGLATGVDTAAHNGSLDGTGLTIGVLGCGLDVVYPRTNKKLYSEVAERGALVTEYCLGTKPDGFRFPARNRIIAGLCRGVVVVEAAKKSGSLITVQHALDEGRDVFAVPGQVDSMKSDGTHWLLQQGALLVISAADIIDGLGLEPVDSGCRAEMSNSEAALGPKSRALLTAIDQYPKQRNELIAFLGMDPAEISEHLLLLELEGLVEILPGDLVRRIDR